MEKTTPPSPPGPIPPQQTAAERLPLRLWPLAVIAALQAVALGVTVTGEISNFIRFMTMLLGPLALGLVALVWWLGFSRAKWVERLSMPGLVAVAALASTAPDPNAWPLMIFYGLPLTLFLGGLALAVGRGWGVSKRMLLTGVAVVLAFSWIPLVRVDGFDGSYWPEFAWRWTPTKESLLSSAEPAAAAPEIAAEIVVSEGDWAEFRGPNRDSRVRGVSIATDWGTQGPREVWKVNVGPSWSSMSVAGGRLYTQEQRGEEELVTCYDAASGELLWKHADQSRFEETVAGPGPRATPTVDSGRVFALGAKGVLNCLDAGTGAPVWRHDLMEELGAPLPQWGFSSSPLVIDNAVIVYADGKEGHGLVAYEAETGKLRWKLDDSGMNYASAQKGWVGGKQVVLFGGNQGLRAIDPRDARVLWTAKPSGYSMAPMVQPQALSETGWAFALGDGVGMAMLDVAAAPGSDSAPTINEVWTTSKLRPAFNDFVQHDGHLYGFNQNLFACLDAATGQLQWKRGRYGFGQVIALEDQGLLIVLSETGEVVLLAADPQEHRELARYQAIEGKTWNHPAIAQGLLYVRNGSEMACLELPTATPSAGDTAPAQAP